MLLSRICWLYSNCLVNTTLWICWHYLLTRQGKSFIFFIMWLLSSQDPTGHQEYFIFEKFPSLLYLLVFFPDILRSCDCIFVFRFEHVEGVAEVLSKCHCSKERGTVTKAKSLFVLGLEIFSKISLQKTIYLYLNKSLQ